MCGPPSGRGGCVIEVAGIKLARGCEVMVPGDADMFMPVEQLDAVMGVGTVSYYITKAPDGVEAALTFRVVEYSLESGQVGMDVSDDETAHAA